jgi:hypothetical protein
MRFTLPALGESKVAERDHPHQEAGVREFIAVTET